MWRFALVWWVVGCKPSAVVLEPVGVAEPVRVAEPASVTGDRDHDGIVDGRDGCPDVAEDVDEFEDEDGCVDRDNDEDGVVDAFEWKDGRWTNCDRRVRNGIEVDCRNLPEDMDGVEDADGCPDILCIDGCQVRLGRVRHDGRGAFIGDATAEFDVVVDALQKAPTMRVHVDAHVEKRKDGEAAKRTSQKVGEKAAAELVRRGVGSERFEVRGFGDAVPIADEKKPGGREANRRVEFMATGLDSCTCRPIVSGPVESGTCV